MVSKIRSFVFMLFSVMLFSGVVYGQYPGAVGEGGVTVDGIFYGEGTAVGAKDNNLVVGGIGQRGDPNLPVGSDFRVELNPEYKNFANNNKAVYVPTYDTGSTLEDISAVDSAGISEQTDWNGLKSPALNDQQYNTIIAYSGGTASSVAAIYSQNVKCHTLILISPMKGLSLTQEEYEKQIKEILDRGAVQRIVVIKSSDDKLPAEFLGYKADFSTLGGYNDGKSIVGKDPRINVYDDINLKALYGDQADYTGEQAHKDLFFKYAMDHLRLAKNGRVYYSDQPISQKTSAFPKNPSSNPKLSQWGFESPMLSPTSDTSEPSAQKKEGTDETSGTSYVNKARDDLWLIDMFFDPSFINKIEHFNPAFDWAVKPPVPMYLPSGEQNTYGYDFIYLPGIEDHFTDTYLNWVATYLNSIGGGDNGGYGGLLLDEDRSGEDGW